MTSPQNFYEAERPLMGTHQLWVPIGPTIQAGIEIAQSQVFFYQSSTRLSFCLMLVCFLIYWLVVMVRGL